MRFTLSDAERNSGLRFTKKKKKKQPVYTHLPVEDMPYAQTDFTQFIDDGED